MVDFINKIKIPTWISYHTYFYKMPDSRTYISNEKSHTYLQLDGISSDLWKMLCDGANTSSIMLFAEENNIVEELAGFIETLVEQELLVIEGASCQASTEYAPVCEDEVDVNEEAMFVEEMQNWLYDNGFMYSLFFELTYRCNLKCVHCYNPKHMNEVELDFDLCKKAIDDAYEIGCFRVTFSGGESTLYSHFLDVVRYAKAKHMSVEIFTNGQLLASNEYLYNSIKELFPYRICISLYSAEKDMHERVTDVTGSFDKTDALIRRLKSDNMHVQIKNFLLNFNCMDCVGVMKYAKKVGATSVADISLIPTIEGDKKIMEYRLDEDELFRLYTNPESPLFIKEDFRPLVVERLMNTSPCLGGISGLCVTPAAEVTICVSLPYSVGNLQVESLKSIWNGAMSKDETNRLYQWQSVTLASCKECYQYDYCAFCNYCPGMGFLENGYLKRSDTQCLQARVKMKAYLYLKENR